MVAFEHCARAPGAGLRPYVAVLTGYRYLGEPPELHRGLPSRYLTVVITLDEPLGVAWSGEPVDKFDRLIGGLHSRAVRIGQSPNVAGIQLALTPAGSRALFGVPPGELAGTVLTLDDILGRKAYELADRLRAMDAWPERFDLVEQKLLEATNGVPRRHRDGVRPEVAWAWRRLVGSGGLSVVQDIAKEVGWSRRHLTQRFTAEYGLPPKVVARVLRFERAVARLKASPRRRLADVAAETGYADQAHFTREWSAIVGCSPRQWITEELPAGGRPAPDAEAAEALTAYGAPPDAGARRAPGESSQSFKTDQMSSRRLDP